MIIARRAGDVKPFSIVVINGLPYQLRHDGNGHLGLLAPPFTGRSFDRFISSDTVVLVVMSDTPRAPADEAEAIMNLAQAGFTVELIEIEES